MRGFVPAAWLVLLAALSLHAQCQPPDSGCEEASQPKVKLRDIRFVGVTQLPLVDQEQLVLNLRSREFAGPDWVELFQEVVRDAWQRHGYFEASVKAEAEILSADAKQQEVSVLVWVEEGQQYRLRELRWLHNEPFRMEELAKLFPLRPGEVFDTGKVRDGLDALRKFYASKGYIDFTAVPYTEVDEIGAKISLQIDLDSGSIFRLGKFEVLGADEALTNRLLVDWELKAGDPFNQGYVERFFQQHRSLFPSDTEPEDFLCRKVYEKRHIVDLALDLSDRECSPPRPEASEKSEDGERPGIKSTADESSPRSPR
jgi:hypothetical protein